MDKKCTTRDEYFIFCAWAFYAFSSFSGIALGERGGEAGNLLGM